MKNNKLKEIVAKEINKKGKEEYRKAKEIFVWDGFSHEIESVVFKDNFHLIVTFKNGTVKDINALDFINNKGFKMLFDKLRDNVELFLKPVMVDQYGITWTDDADIAAEWLWTLGKDIEIGKTAIKKVAFAKIKDLPCGITIVLRTQEDNHPNLPHFHLQDGNEIIGVIAVDGPNSDVDRCKKTYKSLFNNEIREYVDTNKNTLTKIYNAKDGNKIKELSKQLS